MKTEINTITGPVRLTTFWEFLNEVRPLEIQIDRVTFLKHSDRDFNYEFIKQEINLKTARNNPISLIDDLTSQCKKVETCYSDIIDIVNLTCRDRFGYSMIEPTHFFPINVTTYALVNKRDFMIIRNNPLRSKLVCTHPENNFIIKTGCITRCTFSNEEME